MTPRFSLIFLCSLILIFPLKVNGQETADNIDTQLEKLDADLNVAYNILNAFSTPKEKKALLVRQRKWLALRDKETSKQEIEQLYRNRLETLCKHIAAKQRPIMDQILVGVPEIDNQKAIRLLKNCPSLTCRAYLLYFETQELQDEAQRENALKEGLLALFSKMNPLGALKKEIAFVSDDPFVELSSLNNAVLPQNRYSINDTFAFKLLHGTTPPLWFVLRHPHILDYSQEFGGFRYLVEIDDLDEAERPNGFACSELSLGHWDSGTMYKYVFPYLSRQWTYLYYAPDQLIDTDERPLSKGMVLNNHSLKLWALEGPWNAKKYQEVKSDFEAFALKLKNYYESRPYLKKHAPFAGTYLNALVHKYYMDYPYFEPDEKLIDDKLIAIFEGKPKDFQAIKQEIEQLSLNEKDKNRVLSYAILKGYDKDTLEWLLHQGANLQEKVYDEPPLIKASDRPEILNFLIAQGANLEGKTGFGKTALFYAIQFNNLKSVKVLVEAGAILNTVLSKGKNDWKYFSLERVLGFTPLAYSVRYGSEEMTRYLAQKGATLKDIPLETLEEWTVYPERFKRHMDIIQTSSPSAPKSVKR